MRAALNNAATLFMLTGSTSVDVRVTYVGKDVHT